MVATHLEKNIKLKDICEQAATEVQVANAQYIKGKKGTEDVCRVQAQPITFINVYGNTLSIQETYDMVQNKDRHGEIVISHYDVLSCTSPTGESLPVATSPECTDLRGADL